MSELLKRQRPYNLLRSLLVQDCKSWEALLHDNKLHDWDEYEVDEIYQLLYLRKTLDVNVDLARRWLNKVSRTNIHARRVLDLWNAHENAVYFPDVAEEIFEILIFRMLRWQRSSSMIVKIWKARYAIREDMTIDVVFIRLFISMQQAAS